MYPYLGDFPTGKTIAFPFQTFNSSGASVTLTGLAVTDIECYKLPSMTQRSSDAGYALIDTDGIDLDGITGIHGFTIDTSDNTDAGFFVAGTDYVVFVSAVTIDSQTVNFIAGAFSIDNRGLLRPTTASRTLDVTATGAAGIDWGNVENPTTALNLSGTNIDVDQVVASVSGAVASVTGAVGSVTGNVGGNVTGSVGSVATGGIAEASFATTAGSFAPLGIIDQGTAQSATATTLVLRAAAAFADDTIIGATIEAHGSTQGYWQTRSITDYDLATDTATVDAWTVTPSGTITYKIFATPPASASAPPSVLLAANALTATALDSTAVTEIQSGLATSADLASVDSNVTSILADTNELQTDWADGGRLDLLLDGAASAGDPWTTALPGAYSAGSAGYIVGTNVNATVSSRASQTSVDTVDDFLDTEVAAIKAKTDSLTFTVSGQVDANIQSINDVALVGDGSGTPWGPA
jgi:hypothetical protein